MAIGHSSHQGQEPVVVNICAFGTRGDNERLSLQDAATLFHELGHALHGILSKTQWPSQAGTNTLHDWVELPSQLMENWISSRAGLMAHARHAETGELMPQELADKVVAAEAFGQSFHKIGYLQSTLLDMAIHSLPVDAEPPRIWLNSRAACLMRLALSHCSPAGMAWHISRTCSVAARDIRQAITVTCGRRCSAPMSSDCSSRTCSTKSRQQQ